MTRMTAVDAAVLVMEKEGITHAFGIPGAAINPLYAAMRRRGSITHTLARHVEGASHMAERYTRAEAGNIGVCIGTSGPAGTDMITGLYSAQADSIPILCITGQAPRARLYKEDFQAVDIESISKPVTKWSVTVCVPAARSPRLSASFSPDAFRPSGSVLIDLPFDYRWVRSSSISTPTNRCGSQAARHACTDRKALESQRGRAAADRRGRRHYRRRRFGVAGRVCRGDRRAGHPDADGVGHHSRRSPADGRHGRVADLASLWQRNAARSDSSWASATVGPTVIPVASKLTRRGESSCTSTSSRRRSGAFLPDLGIVLDAGAALELFVEVAREWKAAGNSRIAARGSRSVCERKRTLLRKTHFEQVPVKPQRVYEEMNKVFGKETCYVSTIGLSQIAAAQFLHVYKPRHWINCGQAGPLGWTIPAALGVCVADPSRQVVALSGDYDFQFMIEELAVGAQFKLPYIHVLVNNSYLGLIRQSQRGFKMDYSRAVVVRKRERAGAWRIRRRSRGRGRRPGLQGDSRVQAGRDLCRRSSRPRSG